LRAQRPPITKAIDIWALGVTLYCFVFGRCPFIADTEFELFFNVIPKQPLGFPDDIPITDDLRDLFSKLLEKDPNKRITLEEVKVRFICC
jgi:serine/threonine protein kinase